MAWELRSVDLGIGVPRCGESGLWIWGKRTRLWEIGPETRWVVVYGNARG